MNNVLWSKILDFEFEQLDDNYGFVTRLSTEQKWTEDFTLRAILEYKKFMYLAATSGKMVSPSEIVDEVWHLHLIFTESYAAFCKLLGKQIKHIPSTHDPKEYDKFMEAKEWTKVQYEKHFGDQPTDIWEELEFLSDLELEPSSWTYNNLNIVAVLLFLGGGTALFSTLVPIFLKIQGIQFLYGYLPFFGFLFLVSPLILRFLHKGSIKRIANQLSLQNLRPYELAALKQHGKAIMLHGTVNSLIQKKYLNVSSTGRISLEKEEYTGQKIEDLVLRVMKEQDESDLSYLRLYSDLEHHPIVKQVEQTAESIREKLLQTKRFQNIYLSFLAIYLTFIGIGFSRLILGMMNDKPVGFLLISMIAIFIITVVQMKRYYHYFFNKSLPRHYHYDHLSKEVVKQPEWEYFLVGNAALAASFSPLVVETKTTGDFWSGGSCGSGCSSCGGGCGGGCGGCGGCGG
jgi:uncharacterized protein (TIGR04222 family)